MKNVVKILAAFAVVAMIAPQAAEAHSRRHFQQQQYCAPVNCQPAAYNPYGVQWWQDPYGYSRVNTYVGADGYPAWMGGYRPGR